MSKRILVPLVIFCCVAIVSASLVIDRENRFARKGQQVSCSLDYDPSVITGTVMYNEDEYIIISGTKKTLVAFTGGKDIYKDCFKCSPGVTIVETIESTPVYEYTLSDSFIMKKSDCIRDGRYKYRDMISNLKHDSP